MPLDRRTRATLRSAEFGFFGVVVYTRVHTPRRCGLPLSAGVLVFVTLSCRPLRTSCWIVGTGSPSLACSVCFVLSDCVPAGDACLSHPRGRACPRREPLRAVVSTQGGTRAARVCPRHDC